MCAYSNNIKYRAILIAHNRASVPRSRAKSRQHGRRDEAPRNIRHERTTEYLASDRRDTAGRTVHRIAIRTRWFRVWMTRADRSLAGSPTDFDALAKYGAPESDLRSRRAERSLCLPARPRARPAAAKLPVDFFTGYYRVRTGVVLSLLKRKTVACERRHASPRELSRDSNVRGSTSLITIKKNTYIYIK